MYARVKRVESNPLYRGMASSADVALVELEAPVTFTNYILPVCVPDPSGAFEAGMSCWVTGWGSPSEEGNGVAPRENGGQVWRRLWAVCGRGCSKPALFLLILAHVDLSSWVEWVGKQQTGDGKAWAAERWPSLRRR